MYEEPIEKKTEGGNKRNKVKENEISQNNINPLNTELNPICQ